MTPTAYSVGSMNSILPPYEVLPTELITNGDFATDSDWTKGTGWSIVSGAANANTASSSYFYQTINELAVGKTYSITYTITSYTTGNVVTGIGDLLGNRGTTRNAVGTYTDIITFSSNNTNDYFGFFATSSFTGSIDNVSIKEVISADFTFDRNSTATRVNKEGLIETVAIDTPRLDYPLIDGVVQSEPALLLEPSRTNLITYSEDFSDVSWTKNNSIVTSGFTSPDGTENAFKLIEDTSVSEHSISTSPLVGVSDLSISIFVKYAGSEYIVLRSNSSGGTYLNCTFNLLTGVNTFNGFTIDFEITSMPNGWYRISGTNRSSASAFRVNSFILSPTDVQSNTTPIHTGDGTSGVYIYGAQIEAGYLTSYIPTSGSSVTRAVEAAYGAGTSDDFNDSEGVFMAEIAALANDGTDRRITISNSSITSQLICIEYDSPSNTLHAFLYNSSFQAEFTHTLSDISTFVKVGFKYKENDFALWVNGFEVDTDNSGNVFPNNTLNVLKFENSVSLNKPFYGKTKELGYYNTILTDLELETLTSYTSWVSMVNELNLNIIYNG
jgi:hypothetical protein